MGKTIIFREINKILEQNQSNLLIDQFWKNFSL